jgi:hypothetical protein
MNCGSYIPCIIAENAATGYLLQYGLEVNHESLAELSLTGQTDYPCMTAAETEGMAPPYI